MSPNRKRSVSRGFTAFGLLSAIALVAIGGTATAEVVAMRADLSAQAEVPPNPSSARGNATLQFDTATRAFSWRIEYAGLTAPLSAAHFHGTATPATNAGVLVPITLVNQPSPLVGQATISEAQATDLLAGRWYINLHTPAYPAGEIRGQVIRR
jgi:hypothetical protein